MQLNLGKVRPVYQGVYDNTSTYEYYDWVVHEKQAFIALQDIPAGRIPTEVDTAYWTIFGGKGVDGINGQDGAKGDKGDKGDQGVQGDQGIQGEQGPPVAITSSIILDDATIALSAAGGKALKDLIDDIEISGEGTANSIQNLTVSVGNLSQTLTTTQQRVTSNETEISRQNTVLSNKASVDLNNLSAEGQAVLNNQADKTLGNFEMTDASPLQYRVIYGTGQKAVYDPDNPLAIEDAALGTNGVISYNSRYVVENPFGLGTPVLVVAQVYILDKWGDPNFVMTINVPNIFPGLGSYGLKCSFLPEEGLILQTGQGGVAAHSSYTGGAITITSPVPSAPCRIHVWKIGV